MMSAEDDVDDEVKKLERDLANALAEEMNVINTINKLESCLESERFNEVNDLNTSVIRDRVVTRVNDTQTKKDSSNRSEFLEHVLVKHVTDLDTILSGVEFNVEKFNAPENGIGYKFTIESSQVKFSLQFLWLEHSKTLKHTKVDIPVAIHREELAPFIHTLERQNNVHKIIRLVFEYSEAFEHRENILGGLARKYKSTFKYETSDNEGYDFQISDQIIGKKYLEANWSIAFFKNENKMDHCFSFSIDDEVGNLVVDFVKIRDEGAARYLALLNRNPMLNHRLTTQSLAGVHQEIFETLTSGSESSKKRVDIRKLIENLIKGFTVWLQE